MKHSQFFSKWIVKRLAGLMALFFFSYYSFCQEPIALIQAHSKHIKILDGDDLLQAELVPDLAIDVYPYHKSNYPKKVTYYTDVDSISFQVKLGDSYTFGIVLNNTDTCYQQITAVNPHKVDYISAVQNPALGPDTIPFVLGANNAIHIKGRINHSQLLDLIFDTGASIGVLSEQAADKMVQLASDNKNQVEIQGIVIKKSPIIYINYRGGLRADGVVGYNTFEDKLVEINYDKNLLIIHQAMEHIGEGYTAMEMKWRGSATFIEGRLKMKSKECKGLFLFDTGSKWALSLNKAFVTANDLYEAMHQTGSRRARGADGKTIKSKTVVVPQLHLGNLSLANVQADLELPSQGEGLAMNIIGNDVLKRFNVIVDYQKSTIYLKPNKLINDPYNISFHEQYLIMGVVALVALLGILLFFFFKKRKATGMDHSS